MRHHDIHFMKVAKLIAEESKDPSTQVGCVIVDENRDIVSTGYNGFPQGIKDDARLDDRGVKYELIIHAELNAILRADKRRLVGATIYTWPFLPCIRCSPYILQAGITRVISIPHNKPHWHDNLVKSVNLFGEANVEVTLLEGNPTND